MNTRQTILKAAADLILEEGLDAARISKIAKRAGLTDGALYRHFDNKDELLAEVFSNVTKEIESHAKRFSQQNSDDVKERFMRFSEGLFGYFLKQPTQLILFETLQQANSVNKANKTSTFEQSLGLLNSLLNEAKAQKLIREDLRNETMITALYGALSQLVRKNHQGIHRMEQADIHEVLQIFWKGMA